MRKELKKFSFSASAVLLFASVRWDIDLPDGVEVFLNVVGKVTGGVALNADAVEDDVFVYMDATYFKPFRQGIEKVFD